MSESQTATPAGPWKEMMQCKERFQGMVAMLAEYDERTGRYRKFGEPEQHYFRRALVVADTEDLRVFMKRMRGFVFYVVVELRTSCGFCATSWVHEDGVELEREAVRDDPDHPVHVFDSLSDFYRRYCLQLPDDFDEVALNINTIELMMSEVGWRRPPYVA